MNEYIIAAHLVGYQNVVTMLMMKWEKDVRLAAAGVFTVHNLTLWSFVLHKQYLTKGTQYSWQ